MVVPAPVPIDVGMLRDTVRLRIVISHGEAMKAARRGELTTVGPPGKLAASPNGALSYASRLRRDYKREKLGRHGKRIDAELARNCDHAGEGRTSPCPAVFDHPLGGEWVDHHDCLASVNSLPGQFPNELAQIGSPPSTGEIPSISCAVAKDSVEAVITVSDIMKKLRLPNERGERIEFKVQKSQWVTGQLIGVGDNAGPLWRTLAGATNKIIAGGTRDETGVNQNRGIGVSIVGYIGNAAMVPKCSLRRIQQ